MESMKCTHIEIFEFLQDKSYRILRIFLFQICCFILKDFDFYVCVFQNDNSLDCKERGSYVYVPYYYRYKLTAEEGSEITAAGYNLSGLE